MPEKALLDLIYLEPGAEGPQYLQELRLQHLDLLDLTELHHQAETAGKPKLLRPGAIGLQYAHETEVHEYELRLDPGPYVFTLCCDPEWKAAISSSGSGRMCSPWRGR